MADASTRDRLLDLAESRIQTVGFNAFSYHDLAAEIGIKTASIHYYFPNKADLGQAVISRYRSRFNEHLTRIAESGREPGQQLEDFVELFRRPLETGRGVCLCGMLASDYEAIPPGIQTEVRAFFSDVEGWLAILFQRAATSHALSLDDAPESVAMAVVAALEGALLSARTFREPARFQASVRWILGSLRPGPNAIA
jgi:TetR/AcrR family transcriptional regulator, transcriptional repressor for nem operon